MISPKVAWGVGKGHSEVDAKRRERRRGAFEANDVNGLLPRLICSTELICATSVSRRHPSFYIWLTWVGVGWEGVVTWKEQSLILFQAPSNFCNLLDHQTHLKPRFRLPFEYSSAFCFFLLCTKSGSVQPEPETEIWVVWYERLLFRKKLSGSEGIRVGRVSAKT